MEQGKAKGWSSNQIKLLAILAMTIDHSVWLLFPGCQHIWWVWCLHIAGRLTAPIMWFFIAEGFYYTSDVRKYIARLFLFAGISHFAYDFAGGISFLPSGVLNQTGIMWPLAWSVVLMCILTSEERTQWQKLLSIALVCVITLPSDWSCIAAMCPVFLYLNRGNFRKQALQIVLWTSMYAAVYFFAIDKLYGILQMFTALSIPILRRYNGERGKWKGMKWLFYLYYPAHLFVIGGVRVLLGVDSIFP